MILWIDDVRPIPNNSYVSAKSVNEAKARIENLEMMFKLSGGKSYYKIDIIDIDHDAGDYSNDGGDYINLLNWLEETGRNYPIHIHSMNPVGIENMRRIIRRNNWREV